MFLGKGNLKIWSKLTGEHSCRSVISIKLFCNFIEIALRHSCPPVTLLHIFKTSKNTFGELLLIVSFIPYQNSFTLCSLIAVVILELFKYFKDSFLPHSLYKITKQKECNTNIVPCKAMRSKNFGKFVEKTSVNLNHYPAGIINLFKVNKKKSRAMCEICSKLTIKTPKRRHCHRSGVFIVAFEQISYIVLEFPLLTLNK